jgi:hypothetical protein
VFLLQSRLFGDKVSSNPNGDNMNRKVDIEMWVRIK